MWAKFYSPEELEKIQEANEGIEYLDPKYKDLAKIVGLEAALEIREKDREFMGSVAELRERIDPVADEKDPWK